MKLWKKKQVAALSLAVLMALPGCQTPDPGTSGSGTSDPSAQQVEAAATDPTHIYEEVGESFLIDAEISGPPEGVVPKVYRGHYKSFSKEEVDAFLEQVGDSVSEIRSDGIEGKDYCYSGACTSGGSFSTHANADGTTTTSVFSYNRRKNKIYEYPIYINQDDYNDSKEIRLAYLFEEPTDMACGTAAAKVFCRLTHSLYSSTGTGPMREQAKKPFRTFRAVVLRFALPLWYSMATSNTATTTPAANRDQPSRVNSRMVASTQPREKISAPMFPMLVKKAAAAS